jgi:hypothetical protein
VTTPCQHVITLSPGKRGGRPLHPRACECRGRSRLARRRYAHEEILGDFPESTGGRHPAVLPMAANRERRVLSAAK